MCVIARAPDPFVHDQKETRREASSAFPYRSGPYRPSPYRPGSAPQAAYSAEHPGGLTVASRTFTLKRSWYWWGFGVHQAYQDLSAVCVTATESFGMSCVHFTAPAG